MIQPLDESYFEKEENEQSGGIGSAKGNFSQNSYFISIEFYCLPLLLKILFLSVENTGYYL